MSLRCVFKSTFQKAFDKLPLEKQNLSLKALEALDSYFKNRQAPYGLRVKKLHEKTFEAHISADLRILWVEGKEEIVFALLGTHEDVRRFLKKL